MNENICMLRDVAKNGRRSRFNRVWAQSKSYQMSGESKWLINEMLLCNDLKPRVQTSINSDPCLLNHRSSCQFCILKHACTSAESERKWRHVGPRRRAISVSGNEGNDNYVVLPRCRATRYI